MLARTSGEEAAVNRLYDVLERGGATRVVLAPLDDEAVGEVAESRG
jgi:hypothetical protein